MEWTLVRHLPLWAPGAGFLRNAIVWKAKMEEFVDKPYELVKQRMVRFPPPSIRVISLLTNSVCACIERRNCCTVFRHYTT